MDANTYYCLFIADKEAFENGIGAYVGWVDVMSDDVQGDIDKVLADSPTEGEKEWFIILHHGFGPLDLSTYQSIEPLRDIIAFIEEYPEIGQLLLKQFDMDLEKAKKAAIDHDHNLIIFDNPNDD